VKNLVWRIEAAAIGALIWFFGAIGVRAASALGGGLARMIGPLLPVSRVADDNLRRAMPEFDASQRRTIVRGVWDNLGRTVAELPHVGRLRASVSGPGYEAVGLEHIDAVIAAGGPALLISGHLGNWEALPSVTAMRGLPFASFYRAPPNPYLDALIKRVRARAVAVPVATFNKGATGARQALAHLRAGGSLGILIDQKMNDGIEATLFGRPAMTAPAAAIFALRHRIPVVFGWTERLGPARFRVHILPPEPLPDTGDRTVDVATLTQVLNNRLEAAIRLQPAQWLWLHRRWPKSH